MLKKIYIEITNICNLNCSFCVQTKHKKKSMSTNEFHHILKQVAPLTEEICLHVTGEPLLHPDFLEIMHLCEQMQVSVQLTTNGVLLNRFEKELLESTALRQMNFSIQAYMDNYADKKIKEYLLPILDFIKKGSLLRPELYFNLRLWNQGDKNDDNTEVFNIVEKYFDLMIKREVDVGGIKSKRIWNRLYLHFDSRFEWPSEEGVCLGSVGQCKGLIDHIGILADGTVIPCCLDTDGVMSLGNCLYEPLENILRTSRANLIKQGFNQGMLVEGLCQRCSYIRRFSNKLKKRLKGQ